MDQDVKKRRMGPRNSTTWNALLDAAEHVMREEGYAAATSRRIAQEVGVTQQLLYYYFRSMDELLLAAFKRRTEEGLKQMIESLASDRPLRAVWNAATNAVDAKLSFEFVALANHHAGMRDEIARWVTESRQLQMSAIERLSQEKGISTDWISPGAATFLLLSISLLLSREADTGITLAHADVRASVEKFLQAYD